MKFEYDRDKSRRNKTKHGIDFEEAKNLWMDDYAVLLETSWIEEPRWLFIAEYEAKLWTAIITFRGEAVRIISVRRSRSDEVMNYGKRKKTSPHN